MSLALLIRIAHKLNCDAPPPILNFKFQRKKKCKSSKFPSPRQIAMAQIAMARALKRKSWLSIESRCLIGHPVKESLSSRSLKDEGYATVKIADMGPKASATCRAPFSDLRKADAKAFMPKPLREGRGCAII